MDAPPPLPAPGRCLLARLDYGHPPLKVPGWRRLDLAWTGAPPLDQDGRPGLLLAGAERLLGWARTREGAALWEALRRQALGAGLALQCRFPRHAWELAGRLSALGVPLDRRETPADGSIPPLYADLRGRPDLLRLHLEHEWLTAMAAARGGIALLRVADRLAAGPRPAVALARDLSVTTGAVRSYLRWMEDAALVRRAGRTFALRHPLLATLFSPAAPGPAPRLRAAAPPPAAPPAPAPPPAAPSRPWDPIELD